MDIKAFEADMNAVLAKHDVNGAYVFVVSNDEMGSRIAIAGCEELSNFIETALVPYTTERQQHQPS